MSKVVLVTGASRGLGKRLVEYLSAHDYIVYAGFRRAEEIEGADKLWKSEKLNIRPLKLDVTLDEDCRRSVLQVVEEQGRLDVLINCAALVLSGRGENFSSQDYLNILNVNAVGPFRLIKEAIPPMRSQKTGRILNITSLNGLVALPGFSLYGSSKFCLESLGLSWRQELRKDGIWVTNVAPGAVISDDVRDEAKLSHVPMREKFWLARRLMPMLKPGEVVRTVAELIICPYPPGQVLLGRDTRVTTFLNRYLPQRLWDSLLSFVWSR